MKAALAYLEHGWSVIPLNKEKAPLIKWTEFQSRHATKEEVLGWFNSYPEMQIGIVTGKISNLVVIDVEAGGTYERYPTTATVSTGGGGIHLYYKHPGDTVKNKVRIVELTDIRGDGGYVVAPPSASTKGEYSWRNEFDGVLPLFPENIIASIHKSENEPRNETTALVPNGQRNTSAAKHCGELIASTKQIDWEQIVWPALMAWNVEHVLEPLDLAELRKVYESIARSKKNELSDKDDFTLKPYTLAQLYAREFPPVQWVAQDLVPLGVLGAITGESNAYKSFLTLTLAQAVATGTPFLGHFPTKQGKVLILDEENPDWMIEDRFQSMGVASHDNIVFLSKSGIQLDRELHRKRLLDLVSKLKPKLIVLDSLVRVHGKDENSATEMKHVMRALADLVAEDRTVIFIHHHKKDQGYSRKASSGSVRGSSDIFNALDFHIAVERKNLGTSLMIRMLKLRVQKEHDPFKVEVQKLDNLTFTYEGLDTTKDDQLNETKETIREILLGAAEEVSKKEIQDGLDKTSQFAMSEALKALEKEGVITHRKGARGKHLYSMLNDKPEPNQDDVITNEEDLIPF